MARIDFGDPRTFAISVQLAPDHHGVWLFGNLCYWVSNQIVGDFGVTTSLRDVLGQMQQIIRDSGKRQSPALCSAPPDDVFYALDSSLYDGEKVMNGRIPIPLPEEFAVFEGRIPVESFDGWKIFVIDCSEETKILFKQEKEEGVRVAIIDYGIFDKSLLELHDYIDHIFEMESRRSSNSLDSAR